MRRGNFPIALLVVITLGIGFAQKGVPKQPDTHVMAIENVKQLLLVMDADKNGKISKQEWMKFMEGESGPARPRKEGRT